MYLDCLLELLEYLGLPDPWVPLLVLLQLQRLHQGLRHDALQIGQVKG